MDCDSSRLVSEPVSHRSRFVIAALLGATVSGALGYTHSAISAAILSLTGLALGIQIVVAFVDTRRCLRLDRLPIRWSLRGLLALLLGVAVFLTLFNLLWRARVDTSLVELVEQLIGFELAWLVILEPVIVPFCAALLAIDFHQAPSNAASDRVFLYLILLIHFVIVGAFVYAVTGRPLSGEAMAMPLSLIALMTTESLLLASCATWLAELVTKQLGYREWLRWMIASAASGYEFLAVLAFAKSVSHSV